MNQHRQMQQKALRRLAVPNLAPVSGLPLIRSTVSLGRRLEWRKGRSTVDVDMPEALKKRHTYEDFQRFVAWMEKEDGAHYRNQVRLHGPFPHFEPQPNDVQQAERKGSREVARNVVTDTSGNGKEDYVIECLFDVPEYVQEVPTAVAQDIFMKGLKDLRPLRPRDWKEVIQHGRN